MVLVNEVIQLYIFSICNTKPERYSSGWMARLNGKKIAISYLSYRVFNLTSHSPHLEICGFSCLAQWPNPLLYTMSLLNPCSKNIPVELALSLSSNWKRTILNILFYVLNRRFTWLCDCGSHQRDKFHLYARSSEFLNLWRGNAIIGPNIFWRFHMFEFLPSSAPAPVKTGLCWF